MTRLMRLLTFLLVGLLCTVVTVACGSDAAGHGDTSTTTTTIPSTGGDFTLPASAGDTRIPLSLQVFDRTPSSTTKQTLIADASAANVRAFLASNAGLGGPVVLASFGGGLEDLRATLVDTTCTQGARICADPAEVEHRAVAPLEAIATVFGQPLRVDGSDPFGATFELLRSMEVNAPGHSAVVDVYSDFYSISPALDLRSTAFADDAARAAVSAQLAAAGIDFTTLHFDGDVTIRVHLVATELLGSDSATFQAMRALVELVLGGSGATVEVTAF